MNTRPAQLAHKGLKTRLSSVPCLARVVLLVLAMSAASPALAQRSSAAANKGADAIEQRITDNAVRDPDELDGVTVEDRLGHTIDTSITVINEQGETVRLSKYFDGSKPVVLAMIYYSCPVVCPTTLTKLQTCFNEIDFDIGEDFRVVIVSFDHTETHQLAATVKESELAKYRRGATQQVRNNWNFHVATAANARALGNEVGYQFKQLDNGEFSHPVTTVFLTPDGTVSRYIHGFELPKRDVELALIEASDGKIAASFGQLVATFCYRFDPATGSYALSAFRVMQIGGLLTIAFLVVLIGGLIAWEQANRPEAKAKRRPRAADKQTGASASDASLSAQTPVGTTS